MKCAWQCRMGLVAALLVTASCVAGFAQFSIQFPGDLVQELYSGNSIDFGDVLVGSTGTVTYTFMIEATSATAGTVSFIGFEGGFVSRPPFALTGLPSLPTSIPPGGSIQFNVTFSPSAVGSYTNQFVITVSGGWPTEVKTHTVTLTGRGVTLGGQQDGSGTGSPVYDFTTLQTTLASTGQDVAALEAKLDLAQQDTAKLETKLDTLWQAVEGLRTKLLTLASALGELLTGEGIRLYPKGTVLEEPVQPPQPSIVDLVAQLEAKLDQLINPPSGGPIDEANARIMQIYDIVNQISQAVLGLGANVDKLETKVDTIGADVFYIRLFGLARLSGDLRSLADQLKKMQTDIGDIQNDIGTVLRQIGNLDIDIDIVDSKIDTVKGAVYANGLAISALQESNDRIEEKLNRLLGYPAAPDGPLLTLTVTPEVKSAPDHTAVIEGVAGAVEGGVAVNIYWLERDLWRPGATDPFYFDTVTANPDGSFSLTKDDWGSSWPSWCEVTQSNAEGESVPVRVDLSTEMIEA